MDFGRIAIDSSTRQFWAEVRAFFDAHVTDEMRKPDDKNSHDAHLYRLLGERGWNLPHRLKADGGAGLDPLRAHLIEFEIRRTDAPLMGRLLSHMILPAIERYACSELKTEIVTGVARGEVAMCLGYTEPDTGSDLAAVKTRAERDGDSWIINGAKMFTTGAQFSTHCFLLARSIPDAPKHRGLTMFLVPLDTPGIEIRPIQTIGSEATNLVFYSRVRFSDKYRLGEEGAGWRVVSGPLDEEHGIGLDDENHLSDIHPSVRAERDLERLLTEAVAWAKRSHADKDPTIRRRIAELALDLEVSHNTPGPMGRVVACEALIRRSADMLELVAPLGLLPSGTQGALSDGLFEWAHRHAQGTVTYGGTTDIFRDMIARQVLRLPLARLTGNQ